MVIFELGENKNILVNAMSTDQKMANELTLQQFIQIFWNSKFSILVIVICGLIVSTIAAFTHKQQYSASSQIEITSSILSRPTFNRMVNRTPTVIDIKNESRQKDAIWSFSTSGNYISVTGVNKEKITASLQKKMAQLEIETLQNLQSYYDGRQLILRDIMRNFRDTQEVLADPLIVSEVTSRALKSETKPITISQIIVKPVGLTSNHILIIGTLISVTIAFGIGAILSLLRKDINHS